MSHFTVMVIGPDYEGQLAPYDEDIRVPPYRRYWDSEDIRTWERILTDPQGSKEDYSGEQLAVRGEDGRVPLEELVRAYNARYGGEDGDEPLYYEPTGGAYHMSAYNPHSKWDWYTVGGSWRGYFKLKTTVAASALVGPPGVFDNEPEFDADECLKGDVDAEYMRNVRGEEAGRAWDLAQEVFGDTPEARPWREFWGDTLDPTTAKPRDGAIEEARSLYFEQPRVKVVQEHDEQARKQNRDDEILCGFFGASVEDYQVSREQFVQDARDAALAPFAYVYRGEWFAPGKMGWFGISDDEDSERKRWRREFNEFFDSLPDDTELTLVDCHI